VNKNVALGSESDCCGLVDYSKARPQAKANWTTAAIVTEKPL